MRLFSGAAVGSAVAPDISIIAVDMNTAGNTSSTCAGNGCKPGGLSAIQTCAEVDVGSTVQVDVVVDSIPDTITPNGFGPYIKGFDMDLILNSSIVQVSAANMLIGMEYQGTPGGGAVHNTNSTPDSDGDFFMGEVDFSSTGESGKGVLARLTLRGVASGISSLHLQYTAGGTGPNIYDDSGSDNAYIIGTVLDSKIAVHPATCPPATPTPTPSPVPTLGPSMTPTPTFGAAVGGSVTLASQTSDPVPWATFAVSIGGAAALFVVGVWYGRRRWRH